MTRTIETYKMINDFPSVADSSTFNFIDQDHLDRYVKLIEEKEGVLFVKVWLN